MSIREVDLEIQDELLARFPEDVFPVRHGFSTMKAGNMSFKFGSVVGTDQNRRRILSLAGLDSGFLVTMVPQHADKIESVDIEDRSKSVECDALITSRREVGLVLLPADCFPVIITGNDGRRWSYVALIHSGRKGTRLSIVAKTIQEMNGLGVYESSMRVAVGPGIGPCCYNGTDLVSEIMEQVLGAGVPIENIIAANCCTCCSKDPRGKHLFFSRVRSKKTGAPQARFMAFAALG